MIRIPGPALFWRSWAGEGAGLETQISLSGVPVVT